MPRVLDSLLARGARTLRIVPRLALVLTMALALRVHWMSFVAPHDDAYITFRYVENLFAGKGLVYNEGERVFGVSTPSISRGWAP